jgi:hypothetical protein
MRQRALVVATSKNGAEDVRWSGAALVQVMAVGERRYAFPGAHPPL